MRAYGSRAIRMPHGYHAARRDALDLLFYVAGIEQQLLVQPDGTGVEALIVSDEELLAPLGGGDMSEGSATGASLPSSAGSVEEGVGAQRQLRRGSSAQDMRKEAKNLLKQLEKEEKAAVKAEKAAAEAERKGKRQSAKQELQAQEERIRDEAKLREVEKKLREAEARTQKRIARQHPPPARLELPPPLPPKSDRLVVPGSAGDAHELPLPSPMSFMSARSLPNPRLLMRPRSRDERLPDPPHSARTATGKPSILVLETYVAQQSRLDHIPSRSPMRTDYSPRDVQLSYQFFKPR